MSEEIATDDQELVLFKYIIRTMDILIVFKQYLYSL